jgi:transposase
MQVKTEKPPGRPTKYRHEYCHRANSFCKLGATDEELAKVFGVNEATLYRWQKRTPNSAMRSGRAR